MELPNDDLWPATKAIITAIFSIKWLWSNVHCYRYEVMYIVIDIHSPATLLGRSCYHRLGPPLPSELPLFIGTYSTSCWKISSEIVVHSVLIVSHCCCRFIGCTSMMWMSYSSTSPNLLCWIEIWWLWRSFEFNELTVMFKKPVWEDLSFVTMHFPHILYSEMLLCKPWL